MKTKSIELKKTFKCSPEKVYALLMNADQHSKITEGPVKIADKVDAKFEVWDGYCHGYNIELIPGKKIVQAWHFDEENWPSNHFSICTFLFTKTEDGCEMNFEQIEIPESSVENLKRGWEDFYWGKMEYILTND